MKPVIVLVLVLGATSAHAAMAMWTGKSRYVQTVTYQQAIECEYELYGQKFWRIFKSASCPSSVEVY